MGYNSVADIKGLSSFV